MPKPLFERMSEAQDPRFCRNAVARPILERMADAKARMLIASRIPKAFYLRPDDHAEFMATNPTETVCGTWGNNPPIEREDPAFEGVPVRESIPGIGSSGHSRLYNTVGSARPVPQ